MDRDPTPIWEPESFDDQLDEIRNLLDRTEAKTRELEALWTEINRAQRIGQLPTGPERDHLTSLTNELASMLPELEKRHNSDSLERTNDYLIVLTALQCLDYSRDRLGMV